MAATHQANAATMINSAAIATITSPTADFKHPERSKSVSTCGRNNSVNAECSKYLLPVSAGIGGEPLRQHASLSCIVAFRFVAQGARQHCFVGTGCQTSASRAGQYTFANYV